jgi:hypothetical protein
MKHQNVFWGTILITFGLLFLFDRLGVFELEWFMVWRLWPVLIILWGVSILPVRGLFKLVLALGVAALSLFMYANLDPVDSPFHNKIHYNYNYDDNNDTSDVEDVNQVFSHRSDSVKTAKLRLMAGAGEFKLNGTTNELIYVMKSGGRMGFDFKVEELESIATVSLEQKSDIDIRNNKSNNLDIQLNENPVWGFDIEIGAANFDFDLTSFKVDKIDLEGGATSIQFKIGDKHPETDINIDAAASSIKILIPESAGCSIIGSSILSHRELKGFNQVSKGHYETENFSSASQKININVDAAVSSFEVKRY